MSDKGQKVTKKIYVNVAKRRTVNGSVTIASTAKALFTGMFTAISLFVSNNSTVSDWLEIYDGSTLLIGRRTLAANATYEIAEVWLPFFVSVTVNSGTTTMIFTFGGFVP